MMIVDDDSETAALVTGQLSTADLRPESARAAVYNDLV